MISTGVSGAQRLHRIDGIKQFMNFIGMILYVYLILQVTEVMVLYPRPMLWEGPTHLSLAATFMWFQVETGVFIGLLVSNAIFLAVRACIRHKLQLDDIPERKKLPNVDTIIAI